MRCEASVEPRNASGGKDNPLKARQSIYAIFIGILLSSFYLFFVGKMSIRAISRISDIPNKLLYPAVITLCVFGAYAVNNTSLDILVMIVMGLIGFAILRLKIPAAPFLIAFILGPLLEDNFRQSLVLSEGELNSISLEDGETVRSVSFEVKRTAYTLVLSKSDLPFNPIPRADTKECDGTYTLLELTTGRRNVSSGPQECGEGQSPFTGAVLTSLRRSDD